MTEIAVRPYALVAIGFCFAMIIHCIVIVGYNATYNIYIGIGCPWCGAATGFLVAYVWNCQSYAVLKYILQERPDLFDSIMKAPRDPVADRPLQSLCRQLAQS